MDLMSLLRYVFDHNQQVIGGLMVIILATAALLAMRMVAQEKSTVATGRPKSPGADLDLGAIETAFKRVLASQGGVAIAAPSADGSVTSADSVSPSELSERDAKIQELAREIDRLTSELNSRTEGAGFGGTVAPPSASGGGDSGQVDILQAKIAELEGKLTEYEIIEDDIADLSRYKEDNAELRSELEALKARLESAPVAVVSPAAAPAPAPVAPAVVEAPAAAAAVSAEPNPFDSLEAELQKLVAGGDDEVAPAPAASPAPFGVAESAPSAPLAADEVEVEIPTAPALEEASASLDPKSELDEATLKDFASSVEVQKSPAKVAASSDLNFEAEAAAIADGSSVLDDSVDTEKMFEEVSTLAQSTETADDALEGSLDTEKLLAEISNLGVAPGASAGVSASAATPAPATPTPAPAPMSTAAAPAVDEAKFEDDLLAEFKDSNDGGQG